MSKALISLMRINRMKRQMAEQKLQTLHYQKTQVEKDIQSIHVKLSEAETSVYASTESLQPHIDILNVLQWKAIQTKRIDILKLAIVDLDKQQDIIKKEMCQLVVQKQTFEKALSKEKQIKTLAQDKARDESNNSIWVQRNLLKSK